MRVLTVLFTDIPDHWLLLVRHTRLLVLHVLVVGGLGAGGVLLQHDDFVDTFLPVCGRHVEFRAGVLVFTRQVLQVKHLVPNLNVCLAHLKFLLDDGF